MDTHTHTRLRKHENNNRIDTVRVMHLCALIHSIEILYRRLSHFLRTLQIALIIMTFDDEAASRVLKILFLDAFSMSKNGASQKIACCQ